MATPPFHVKALYDYNSNEADDLSFSNGQIIQVTDEEDADWYYGEYADTAGERHEGLFPKNFVKIYEPETPARPSRTSRPKKETEISSINGVEHPPIKESEASSVQRASTSIPVQEADVIAQALEQKQLPPPQPSETGSIAASLRSSAASKQTPTTASKPTSPLAAEKPASGSFRDRINAFNKSTAPPPAPLKPSGLGASGGSGFVKKPFVAPPPSKNAYVPPPREAPAQKVYRREEDNEPLAQASNVIENDEQPSGPQIPVLAGNEEGQQKPTSLKERIALLQKQQMEQAARHAEAGQKKEKPKRPSRKQVEPQGSTADQEDDAEGEILDRINSAETTSKRLIEGSHDAAVPGARSITRSRKSREATPVGSPLATPAREFLSDPNDADQSGIGDTEDGEELSTGRDDSDEKPRRTISTPPQRPSQLPSGEADVGDEEDDVEEDDAEEEDEENVDPEVQRRIEIRERMAKMSGGMGMAGMFGPPGGMPPRTLTKQGTHSSERNGSGNSISTQRDSSGNRAPPVPILSSPGLQRVRSPEQFNAQPAIGKEETDAPKSIVEGRVPEDMPDVEDMGEEPIRPQRRSTERPAPPPILQDRPVPALRSQDRGAPPSLLAERPVPPSLSESTSIPLPNASQTMSPSEGSESDDEMSLYTRSSLRIPPATVNTRPISREGPPPIPAAGPPPSLPSRPAAPQSQTSDYTGQSPPTPSIEASPSSRMIPAEPPKRNSRVPPIPGSNPLLPSVPQNRAPPPPPPTNAPPTRTLTGDSRAQPTIPQTSGDGESDEEVTAYEGDYDTDIAPGATHKDALKSHARTSSLEDDFMTEEASFQRPHSLGPTSSAAPRAVPPPPPNQSSRSNRQSSDMPRGAPPLPPPPKEKAYEDENGGYVPYKYNTSRYRDSEGTVTPKVEEPESMFSASPPQRAMPPATAQNTPQYPSSTNMAAPGRSGPRKSTDIQRTSTSVRRSTDAPRLSGEQGFIAGDVDLSQGSQWWAQPDVPPPVFQNRRDLIFEIEETSTTRRGGKQAVTKVVYVLFMDYSQTIITAHFEARDPANASIEQRHEPPPQNLRQDQLENAHMRFGSRIAEAANAKKETVVGDGSSNGLVLDLLSAFPEALLPVGVRAYGALVYANLANASVRQFDEIRAGDIVTFRNARFQGHRGPMHSKYSVEVGMPDHVGVIIDWDGTKKKVRAWEQGRESKKVKPESFKFGDLRSGEVKVWRVMARDWVGWEGQN